jgi:malate synthase
VMRDDVSVSAADLLKVPQGEITESGLRQNIRVGLQYIEAWLGGSGCVPIYHLMEDTATAEICRAQLWQWLHHEARTSDGKLFTPERFDQLLGEEIEHIHAEVGSARMLAGVFPSAARLFSSMVKSDTFDDFMTLPAYDLLG